MGAERSAELRAVLEGELTWRRLEIKELRNMLSMSDVKTVKESYKRALIVMLYAHLEGFVRATLEEYAKVINDAQVKVFEARKQLSAACLVESFKKHRISEPSDPLDPTSSKARQVLRDAQLVEDIIGVKDAVVKIDVASVCSTDSNLTPTVLRRNLTLLALEGETYDKFARSLNGLLMRRNAIAHGEKVRIRDGDYLLGLERDVFNLCENLMISVYRAVRDEEYKR